MLVAQKNISFWIISGDYLGLQKTIIIRIPIKQPGLNGKYPAVFFFRGSPGITTMLIRVLKIQTDIVS